MPRFCETISMLRKPALICFDLDGTLIDSTPLSITAYKSAIQTVRPDLYEEINFYDFKMLSLIDIVAPFNCTVDEIFDIKEVKNRYFESLYCQVKMNKALIELIPFLNQSCDVALVSNASRFSVDLFLKNLRSDFPGTTFDFSLCRDDVSAGKPSPDLYIAAADFLGKKYTTLITYEDSDAGILAAQQAGFNVIKIVF